MTITVKEFVSDFIKMESVANNYTEIKYGDRGTFITRIRDLINKAGIEIKHVEDIDVYDEGVEEAVIEFQEKNRIKSPIGIIDDNTLNALINASNNLSDIIYSENAEDIIPDTTENNNPHFDSFFSKNNTKNARKNNKDIIIKLGNDTVIKTIHNVYMRGVSTEYDTSGNPISETYEFIAQDLTESDEVKDNQKYE